MFYQTIEQIDSILRRRDINRAIVELIPLLETSPVLRAYFIGKLSNVRWLPALRNAGMFMEPPNAVEYENERRFPNWPESTLLRTMAGRSKNAATLVHDIILDIPETNNVFIHNDFLRAAAKMPASLANDIAERACVWLVKYPIAYPDEYVNLTLHLLRRGEIATALQLTRCLLHSQSGEERWDYDRSRPQPEARFPIYHYREAVEKLTPELPKYAGINGLGVLCDLLAESIDVSYKAGEIDAERVAAYYWYRSLADEPDSHYASERELLIAAVRDAACTLAEEDKASLRDIVSVLRRSRWHTFTRVEMHVLLKAGANELDLIRPHLLDYDTFDKVEPYKEYSALLSAHFSLLTKEDQDTILGWIDTGPDIEPIKQALTDWLGQPVSEKETESYLLKWRYDRIRLIESYIPKARKPEFVEIVERYEEECQAEEQDVQTLEARTTNSGSRNAELGKLSIPAVADFLAQFEFDDNPRGPSPDGIGEQLCRDVEARPTEYSQDARAFVSLLEPTYVRAVIDGLHRAARNKKAIHWKPVIELCEWAMSHDPMSELVLKNGRYKDPNWTWTRKAIASLLESGFSKDSIPIGLKDSVWGILTTLAQDPQEEPEPQPDEDDWANDSLTRSLNYTRGKAFHAIFEYATWVWRNTEKAINRGIAPEAKEFLQHNLQSNAAYSIQAVYGLRYPQIVAMDRELAARWTEVIYPLDEGKRNYFTAAWNAYISYNNAYDNVFESLHSQYNYAIHNLNPVLVEGRRITDAERRMGQHLTIFYVRGLIDLYRSNMLARYFDSASDALRKDTMSYIGHNLVREVSEWDDGDPLNRLQSLWEWRVAHFREHGVRDDDKSEVSSFGWWFGSGEFPEPWALAQLKVAVDLAGEIQADDSVISQLINVQDTNLDVALDCLGGLIDSLKWRSLWLERSCALLERGLASRTTHEKALTIINKAAATGHIEVFRDLWNRRNELLQSE